MGTSEFTSVNPRLMQTILRYLDGLRRNVDGDELYGVISRVLRRHQRLGPIGAACFTDLHYQLDAYANDPVALPAARIKARLLQQHIAPYLLDQQQPETAAESKPPESTDVSFVETTVVAEADDHAPAATDAVEGTLQSRPAPLTAQRQRYQALQRSEQDAWQAIYKVANDFGSLKQLWNDSFEEMSQERQRLAQKLNDTEQTLQNVETSCQQLRDDLATAQRAPARKVPRRVTRLPRAASARLVTRDIFMQQLQAEVSRVKRTGSSVSLAMLGVQELAEIARQYGDGANTAVLGCYAREILSGFRAYDIVGRYDDDVFAVLLPDTGQDGAVRALEKAQKRAIESHVSHDGHRFPLPGFCGALTVYTPGEEPALWLRRTESAVDTARREKQDDFVVG